MLRTVTGEQMTILWLRLLPKFLQLKIAADPEFRRSVAVPLDGTVTVGQGFASFTRSHFLAAVRKLYSGKDADVTVIDETSRPWIFSIDNRVAELTISINSDTDVYKLRGIFAIHPDRDTRLNGLDQALHQAGIDDLPHWRKELSERPLDDLELDPFNASLAMGPRAVAAKIAQTVENGEAKVSDLVPEDKAYFEHLVGATAAESLDDYIDHVLPAHIETLLRIDHPEGAKQALALGIHSRIATSSVLKNLEEKELRVLGEWATQHGDLFSKVAFVELALSCLAKAPGLSSLIENLVTEIRDLDETDENGRLQFLSALAVFSGAEISRTKVLDDWKPFQRRLAALAHASLIERETFDKVDRQHFAQAALQSRVQRFYLQSLADLRREPRWQPDFIAAEQLKNEFLGRMLGQAGNCSDAIVDSALKELLLGHGPGSLRTTTRTPMAYYPGPLEGAYTKDVQPLPDDFERIIAEQLATVPFAGNNLYALLNLHAVFRISGSQIAEAVEQVRRAGIRLLDGPDGRDPDVVLIGLAFLAAGYRNTELAGLIQSMTRRLQIDTPGASRIEPHQELMIALICAASHEELGDWCKFIGPWAEEIARSITTTDQAAQPLHTLQLLCKIIPPLRLTTSRAIASLKLLLGWRGI